MYVRDAKNRDEVWLLDHIERMGLDDVAFRSRDYVIAVDEKTNERAGFGRIRIHKGDADGASVSGRSPRSEADLCELTGIGVLDAWRGQGVGAHVVERLVEKATDDDFDVVYSLTDTVEYLTQFGFEPVDTSTLPPRMKARLEDKRETASDDVVGMRLDVDDFVMPPSLREAFKHATPGDTEPEEPRESPEDFGIDPETATYKYDTGRRK
ncbi:MAG: GNAT family N-acetyltransferase [Halobacteriota archaeon]